MMSCLTLFTNSQLGVKVLCFSLTGRLLRKMSADHLQHVHVEVTLINTNGSRMSLQEPVAQQAAEKDVLYAYCMNINICRCSVSVLQYSTQNC